MYEPLARLLSVQLDEVVTYEHPRDWIEYATKMKQDHYDIIFDGPHFAAWRIKHLGNVPVAKLPGVLVFMVVVNAADEKLRTLRDVLRVTLCGVPSPWLGTMVVMSAFNSPIVQPEFYEVADIRDVYESFKAGKCRAAVMQKRFYDLLPAADRERLRAIFVSPGYPGQTFTASQRVNATQRARLAQLLTARSGVPELQEFLSLYAKQVKTLDVARLDEFEGMENLLEGVIWGW